MPMNMGHCRFENTLAALRECQEAANMMNEPKEELSESEYRAFVMLAARCRRFADDFEGV